jgi:hypothetical protein
VIVGPAGRRTFEGPEDEEGLSLYECAGPFCSVLNVLIAFSIEVLAEALGTEAIEFVRLNMPRGVLDGRSATSLVTVPLAGLYMASGTFGNIGTELSILGIAC